MNMSAAAVTTLHDASRAIASTKPDALAALVKDMSLLVKLLRNPAEQPEEPKFRKLKLSNATIARVLGHAGVRGVLQACGFAACADEDALALGDVDVAHLLRAVEAVEALHQELQELNWLYATRTAVPSLAAQPWAIDLAAEAVVHACLCALHTPDESVTGKTPWLQRLCHMLTALEMRTSCKLVHGRASVATVAVRRVALELVHAHDLRSLAFANRCLAALWAPGDPRTLAGRVEFCSACLAVALPPEEGEDEDGYGGLGGGGGGLELKLRLVRGALLRSTCDALGAFSEMGVRCGVLKQELKIEYVGENGQDAGGLRRQFFDLFAAELARSDLWTQTPTGSLCPADAAAAAAAAAETAAAAAATGGDPDGGGGGSGASSSSEALRVHMRAVGRVCGMALYQEVHRRSGVHALVEGGAAPPSLLGMAFARHFVRLVQHDAPSSLAQLQAELAAECLESSPDFRAGDAILHRSLIDCGLDGQTFTRTVAVGGREVRLPLVADGDALVVTEGNKSEWLERLLRSELVDAITEAAEHFRRGLLDVVGLAGGLDAVDAESQRWMTPHFCLLSAEELQRQWSGAPVSRACIEELRRITTVHPDVTLQAAWLWEVMLSLDDERRAKVYRFVTGSSRRPADGVAAFQIGPRVGEDGAYPFAHACASVLELPRYSSQAVLHERLETAVQAAHDKFTDL